MNEFKNSKLNKESFLGKFGHLDFGFACPVKFALSDFWLMDGDPSGKEKSSVSGKIT